jgi:hypothetical protein
MLIHGHDVTVKKPDALGNRFVLIDDIIVGYVTQKGLGYSGTWTLILPDGVRVFDTLADLRENVAHLTPTSYDNAVASVSRWS